MPLKQVQAVIRRKQGIQYYLFACPYCRKRHWLAAGSYVSPAPLPAFRHLPCNGSEVELVPARPKSRRSVAAAHDAAAKLITDTRAPGYRESLKKGKGAKQ